MEQISILDVSPRLLQICGGDQISTLRELGEWIFGKCAILALIPTINPLRSGDQADLGLYSLLHLKRVISCRTVITCVT